MRPQVIVDCETTGLDPARHQLWELGLIERETGTRHLWRTEPDLARADPAAMQVNRYYERTRLMRHRDQRVHDLADGSLARGAAWTAPGSLAPVAARLLDGVTLIGANPAFDAGFLSAFLAAHGELRQPWHYRLRDIGSMALGYLRGRGEKNMPPADAGTDDLARALGVDPDDYHRHSALGDCLLVEAMLAVIEGGKP